METFELTRQPDAVARRLLAVAACAAAALHAELREDILDWFQSENLLPYLSDEESAFLMNPAPSDQQMVQFSWYIEAATVLGWALCLKDNLPPPTSQSSIGDIVEVIPAPGEPTSGFISEAKLRPTDQLCEAAAKLEQAHAQARSDRDNNRVIRGGVDLEVVGEQHRAIKWVVADEGLDWQFIATNT